MEFKNSKRVKNLFEDNSAREWSPPVKGTLMLSTFLLFALNFKIIH